MKSKKSTKKPQPDALAIVGDPRVRRKQLRGQQTQQSQKAKRTLDFESATGRLAEWLAETFGTTDPALQDQLLSQAASAVPNSAGREIATLNHLSAALHGIRPKDSLEGMLAIQMVAVHTLAMTCMGRATREDQSDLGVEVNVNRATKLIRTFVIQTEALVRYRGKGEQKMVVEHVHIHKGGQAIVGPVSQNSTQNNVKCERE